MSAKQDFCPLCDGLIYGGFGAPFICARCGIQIKSKAEDFDRVLRLLRLGRMVEWIRRRASTPGFKWAMARAREWWRKRRKK